ncbi:DUF1007 family protein [Spirabiliibacterium falconis]|uniref:DUF1007 family protein n=1 Tax=Spirabiliibacterium falconis TaxID=572023 RepID=UPI001AACC9B2|nr:DUF1007 family protein [Spirabiliibacterium falconis]MBE2894604.1 DUF1007 family protein [Spirabiliibacterium falconis]
MLKVRFWFIAILFAMFSQNTFAHPHAFIDLQTTFLSQQNKLIGMRMQWLFDEPSSAEILYELRTNKTSEKRDALAADIMQNIVNQHYFSFFYNAQHKPIKYTSKPSDYGFEVKGNKLLFYFTFYLTYPQPLSGLKATLQTYDPSYYVEMSYPKNQGAYPPSDTQCTVKITTPSIDESLKQYANALDKSQKDEDFSLGVQFAQRVELLCP